MPIVVAHRSRGRRRGLHGANLIAGGGCEHPRRVAHRLRCERRRERRPSRGAHLRRPRRAGLDHRQRLDLVRHRCQRDHDARAADRRVDAVRPHGRGQLDYDQGLELGVVVNETTGSSSGRSGLATYYLFDDANAGRALLRSGSVQANVGGIVAAAAADIKLADIDGDGLDEVVFAGATNLDGVPPARHLAARRAGRPARELAPRPPASCGDACGRWTLAPGRGAPAPAPRQRWASRGGRSGVDALRGAPRSS